MAHITVLLDEAVAALAPTPGATMVDATLGSGGHAQAIAKALGPTGKLIACDVDPTAISDAQLWKDNVSAAVTVVESNFAELATVLAQQNIGQVDGILADLGWRSEQFVSGDRGFSFTADEPVRMTYGDPEEYLLTAADIVNDWAEADIANVLFGYGEEHYARRIARAIVAERVRQPITTSIMLADIISQAVPGAYRRGRTHPATKSFQALRIAVNDELTVLDTFITAAINALAPGGRLAIITFHSLEDRVVKHRFRELSDTEVATLHSKKPIIPSPEERHSNPRARSAKLRALTKR